MNLLIQDNFFDSVSEIRELALSLDYRCSEDIVYDVGWKGYRTEELDFFNNDILVECEENILNSVCNFYNLTGYSITTYFHISYESTKNILNDFNNKKYHFDLSEYAGVIYLTPDPPKKMGTSILDGNKNKIINVENIYNRLLAYPSSCIHAPTDLFGDNKENGRMTLTFFLDKDSSWSL